MYRVYIAEDEDLIRKGLQLITDWKKVDCEVIGEADNGITGAKEILQMKPDIVITDVKMPGATGIEMIEEISKEYLPAFIIISGYADFSYAKSAIRLGVVEYILKPIDNEELENALLRAGRAVSERNTASPDMGHIPTLINALHPKDILVKKCLLFIEQNYSKRISSEIISNSLGTSRATLCTHFKAETGYSLNEYITKYRLQESIRLIAEDNYRIYEVAEKVGFSDYKYFYSVFKKNVGCSLSDFIRTYRAET